MKIVDTLTTFIANSLNVGVSSNALGPIASIFSSDNAVGPNAAMSKYRGWTFAAVNAISEEISATEWQLYQINADGTEVRVLTHDVLDLLMQPCEGMTGSDMLYLLGAHLEITGNAYVYMELGANKKPIALYVLDPRHVTPAYTRGITRRIAYYRYSDGNTIEQIDPSLILHFRNPNPLDPLGGIGAVSGAME